MISFVLKHKSFNQLNVTLAQFVEQETENFRVLGPIPRSHAICGVLAQLARASACHAEGQEFESLILRQIFGICHIWKFYELCSFSHPVQ